MTKKSDLTAKATAWLKDKLYDDITIEQLTRLLEETFDAGESQGYDAGKDKGYDNGYNQGYTDGQGASLR